MAKIIKGKINKRDMGTSIPFTIKNALFMRARRFFLLISFSLITLTVSHAQAPSWVVGTPAIPSTGPLSITCNYGINMTGTVYIVVYNYSIAWNLTGGDVKWAAGQGPSGGRVATMILPITAGNINIVLQTILTVVNANTLHTIFFAAESSGGIIQAVATKLFATTLPCPKIQLFTFFGNLGECFNLGAQGMFQVAPLGLLPTGILKGSTWSIDWGDGSPIWTYTSTADNDLPGIQTHLYASNAGCAYQGTWTVKNPCNEFLAGSSIIVVHGRDIPIDGDGLLRMEETSTHTPDIIYLCEGVSHTITVTDISRWNCQTPVVPFPLISADYDNDKPRTLQFVYGETPAGAVMNTITGNVLIGGVNIANAADGYVGPVITPVNPPNPNTVSQTITIPATSVFGQRFYVYLKNWNKCNPYLGNPNAGYEYEDFIIEIIDAPPAPIVVTPKNYCFGSVPITISATPNLPGNTINWYADAGLTTLLNTGQNYTHGKTAVGTYSFWVTETSGTNGCKGPASQIDMIINPLPNKPTVTNAGPLSFCYDSGVTSVTLTANPNTPPAITSYQWYKNGIIIGGAVTNAITLSQPTDNGNYTVRTFGINPSNCPAPLSDPVTVTIYSLTNITHPTDKTVCEFGSTTFSASTTDAIQAWKWEVSTDGGATWGNANNGLYYNGFNSNTLNVVNTPLSFNGNRYRVQITTTAGGCIYWSNSALLTVSAIPTVTAGAAISRCDATPLAAITMTGASATGTYSAATWTGGGGLGNWAQNVNPANATFTPTVASGSFIATLTVTGSGSCAGTNPASTRTISWSQIPVPTAGAAISRCSTPYTTPIAMAGATATGTYSAQTWSGGGGLGTWTQNAVPALATFTPTSMTGSFTATLALTGSGACTGTNPTSTRTVAWSQTPVPTAGSNITRCDATPLAAIAMTGATSTGIYSAQAWSGGGGLGGWTQNANPALAAFTPTVNSGSFIAVLTLTGSDACTGTNPTSTRTIDWGYLPTVNAGPDQGICALSSATLAGAIGGGASSATWSGGGGTYAPNNTTLNAVYTPSAPERAANTVTLTLTTNDPAGLCTAVSDNITIAIGTSPTSATLTGSGNACAGATSTIKSVMTGGAQPYTINYTRNGVAQPAITPYTSGTDFSLGILPAGTYNYLVTSISDFCGNTVPPGQLPPVYTIIIYANPVANAGPDQSVCGALVTPLAAVASVGTGTWTKISGPGTVTFSNAASATSTATVSLYGTYVLRWTEINGGICTSFDEVSIAYAEAANAGPDQQKCGTLVATLAGNTPTIGAGAWTKISGPGTVTFSNAASATSTATVSLYGTYVLRWTITNGSCNTFDEVTIAYAETANAGTDQTLCGTLVATLAGNAASAGAGAWTKISGPGTVTFSNAASATSTATGSLYGTYVLRWTITNGSCNTFDEVTIAYAETANAGPDQQKCGILVATLAGNAASAGAGTWTKISGPGTVTFSNAASPTSTATVSLYGTYVLRWTITNGSCNTFDEVTIAYAETANAGPDQQKCGVLVATLAGNTPSVGSGAWTKISGPGTVTFSNAASPVSTATVSLYGTYVLRWTMTNGSCNTFDEVTIAYAETANAGPDQNICGTLVATLAGNAASAGAGAWTKISGPGTVTFSNAASPISTATVSLYGTYVLRWTITNGSCNTFDEVTVSYEKAASAGPAQDLCNTLATALAGNAPAVGTGTWTIVSGPGTVIFTPNANTATATATVTAYGAYVFKWTIDNGGVCNTNQNVTINYNPAGQVNAISNQVLCNGAGTTAVNFTTTNIIGTTTYSWTNSASGIGLAAIGSGNIASFTAVNAGTAPVVATIVVTPTLTNAPANCVGPTQTFTITVNPTPILSGTLTPTDNCSNTVFSYPPASATAGTTFNWSRAVVAGITPAGPTLGINNPNETLRNITNAPIAVTYQYTLAANGCSNVQNVVVNIKPEPVITPLQTTGACSGNALNYRILLDNFTNPADNVTFTWGAPVLNPVNPGFTGGTARGSASAANITDTFINTMGVVGIATYTITPYRNGCTGATVTVIVTVGSEPVLDPGLNAFACSNAAIGLILKEAAGSVIPSHYNIMSVTIAGGLTADPGNAPVPNAVSPAAYLSGDKYTNTTGVNKTVTYRVQPVLAPTCFGVPVDVVITIRPQPMIMPAQTKIVCSGVAIGKEILLIPANNPAGTLFNWPVPVMSDASSQGTAGVNVAADPANTLHINDVINNYSSAPITATYTITPVSQFGCAGNPVPVVIIINQEPIPQPISGRTDLCVGDKPVVYNVNPVGGSSFHWTVAPAVGSITFDFNTNAILIDAALVAGSGNITVYETNSLSCSGDPSTLAVQVYSVAVPENIAGPAIVCANSTQVYSVTNRVGSVYNWTVPGGAGIIGDPSASSVSIIFGNVGGTILVRETNIAGCITNHTPFAVTVNPLPTALISNGGNMCDGGTRPLNVAFTGTAPFNFTYAINGVSQAPISTSSNPYTINATLAGTYTIVNVTDNTGCTNTGSGSTTITYFPKPTGIISGGGELCRGSSTTLTMTFTGVAPFTFTYTNGTTPVTVTAHPTNVYTASVSPLITSTFTLTSLTDFNNCVGVLSGSAVINVNQPTSLSLTGTNLICYNVPTGAVDMTISGGTAPFGIAWTGPNGFTSPTEDISGLNEGYYAVTVTDSKGCIATANITLTQPPVLNAAVTGTAVTCYGSNDGTITISGATGGTGTYEYTINGTTWAGSGTFAGVAPGTYNVQIRDLVNPTCILVLNPALVITQPTVLNATLTKTDITCFGANNGSIIISDPTGGYGTYQYSNDGGTNWQDSPVFPALPAGSYDVRIRDRAHQACVVILPAAVITVPAVMNAIVTPIPTTCNGSSDGRVEITLPTGGYGSYQYSINAGASWQASPIFTGLVPGNYTIRMRDALHAACYVDLNPVIVTQPAALSAVVAGTNVTCFGSSDGTITITNPSGGYGTYEYTINGGGSWQSTGTFSNLAPGSYNVMIRDAAQVGCIIVLNNAYMITQPGMLSATITKTEVSCNGNNDGTISITSASEGYGTYEYSIDGGLSWQASGNYTSLAPVTYDVRIRDAAHTACSVILYPNLVITEPVTLSMSSTGDILLDCYGDVDGIGIFYASGGTMPYTFFTVSNNTSGTVAPSGFNSQTFFNAGAGSITLRVVDFNGCSAQATVNITQPAILNPGTIATDQVVCYGDNPAMLTESSAATGGPAAYIFQWQSSTNIGGPFVNIAGATLNQYTPSAGATYTLYYRRMVTSGTCMPVYSNVVQILVNARPVAFLTGGETICPGQSSIIKVTMMAGTGPFTVEIANHGIINNYISGSDIVVAPAVTTAYTLTRVRDANNCEVVAPSPNLNGTATVIVSNLPVITSFTPSPAVCEFTLANFKVTATGTNLTYQWFVNQGSGFNAVVEGGTYFGATTPTLQIFNTVRTMNGYVYHVVVSGCGTNVTSADATFTVNTAPEITLHPKDSTICLGQNAVMEADATGTNVTWKWYVNKGSGFVLSVDDANFSGSATRTLTITNAQASFNNWIFGAIASGTCVVPVNTNFAVLRVINTPAVTLHPVPHTICENGSTSFLGNGTGYTSLQWQVFSGGVWTDLTDNAIYLGSNDQQLAVINAPGALNGNQYRLALITICSVTYSNAATLTVNSNPVVDFSTVDPIAACGGVPIVINGNPAGGSGTYTQHRWTGDIGPLNNYFIQSPTFNSLISGSYSLNYRVTDSNGCTANDDVVVSVDSPSAQFNQDVDFGCNPLDVTFTKDMTGISKWWWDFGDGSPLDSLNANPAHTFINNVAGSIEYFNAKLRVRSTGGCYAEFTSVITVYPSVDATFTPNVTIICSGNSIIFTALPGARRYFWEYGDGASGYATNTSGHLYTNLTTDPVVHTVKLTTTSFYNCVDVKTFDITVMPVPLPQFTADPLTQVFNAAGNTVTFTNTTNAGTWNWLWRFGDKATSTDMNPVHAYTDFGTYNVTLVASNANCSDSVKHSVSVIPPAPVADFDSIPSGCAPLYVNINNTSLNTEVPGTTYRWDFGDGSKSTAKNPTYTYFTAGTYRIELVVTGPGGTSMKSQVVNAYASPKAYFEVMPPMVYVNDERIRCFNLTEEVGTTTYLWEFGDGDTSKVKEPFHRYMEEGIFDITLWAYSANGCTDTYVLSPAVTVEPVGELRFSTVFMPNKTGPIERTDLPTGGVEIDQFFFPAIRQKVLNYKLQVFNRLGVLIFESRDINVPWNGYYKGKLCQQGVYVWYVEGKYADGKPFKMVGSVTLLQ